MKLILTLAIIIYMPISFGTLDTIDKPIDCSAYDTNGKLGESSSMGICNQDLSLAFLDTITAGLSSEANTQVSIFAAIAKVFNEIALNFAIILLIYHILIATVFAASTGQFLGEEGELAKYVRVMVGIALLTINTSGFSQVQVLVYDALKFGIATADYVWSVVVMNKSDGVRLFANGVSANTEASLSQDTKDIYKNLWRSLLCSYAQNRQAFTIEQMNNFPSDKIFSARYKTPSGIDWYGPQIIKIDENNSYVTFGSTGSTSISENAVSECGRFQFPKTLLEEVKDFINVIHKNAIELVTYNDVNGSYCAGDNISNYSNAIATALPTVRIQKSADNQTAEMKKYLNFGWIAAGFYYNKSLLPTPPSSDAEAANFKEQYSSVYNTANLKAPPNKPEYNKFLEACDYIFDRGSSLEANSLETSQKANSSLKNFNTTWLSFLSAFGINLSEVAKTIGDLVGGNSSFIYTGQDPFYVYKVKGRYMMDRAIGTLIVASISMVAYMGLMSWCSAQSPTEGFAKALLNTGILWLLGLIPAIYMQGAMLAIFLPLIPTLVYLAGVLGWMIAVIEAIVAAPLLALGLVWPDGGHDIFGRSEPGIFTLINIMLRPVLMVAGFVAGMCLCWIAFSLLTLTFATALNNSFIQPDSLLGWLPLGMSYSALVLAIAAKSFTTIFELPDKVLIWVGQQASSWGDADELVQAAKAGIEKGTEEIEQMTSAMSEMQQKNKQTDAQLNAK